MRHGFLLAIDRLDQFPQVIDPSCFGHEYTLDGRALCTKNPHSIPITLRRGVVLSAFYASVCRRANLEIHGREVCSFNADPGNAVQLQVSP
jgi:hypothetical protein